MVDKGEGQPSLADITSRLGMDHSYKASKQAFVSELSGSNITHVLLISLVAWVCSQSNFSVSVDSLSRLQLPWTVCFVPDLPFGVMQVLHRDGLSSYSLYYCP